eukprot:58928-Hanusia_phi.AAC.1
MRDDGTSAVCGDMSGSKECDLRKLHFRCFGRGCVVKRGKLYLQRQPYVRFLWNQEHHLGDIPRAVQLGRAIPLLQPAHGAADRGLRRAVQLVLPIPPQQPAHGAADRGLRRAVQLGWAIPRLQPAHDAAGRGLRRA